LVLLCSNQLLVFGQNLSNNEFKLGFSQFGVASLKHTRDVYDTDYILAGRSLGDVLFIPDISYTTLTALAGIPESDMCPCEAGQDSHQCAPKKTSVVEFATESAAIERTVQNTNTAVKVITNQHVATTSGSLPFAKARDLAELLQVL
jgi:hypothetical protein